MCLLDTNTTHSPYVSTLEVVIIQRNLLYFDQAYTRYVGRILYSLWYVPVLLVSSQRLECQYPWYEPCVSVPLVRALCISTLGK